MSRIDKKLEEFDEKCKRDKIDDGFVVYGSRISYSCADIKDFIRTALEEQERELMLSWEDVQPLIMNWQAKCQQNGVYDFAEISISICKLQRGDQ